MSAQWLAVVNPTAGAGRAQRRWIGLDNALRARGVRFETHYTTRPGEATEVARTAGADFKGLLVVGGDGTVHEVVNGLSLDRPPTLAVAPFGTGNDWARGLGIPQQAAALAQLIARGHTRPVEIGALEYQQDDRWLTRRFVNGAGLGLDAEILACLPTQGPHVLTYLRGTLRAIRRFQAPAMTVRWDAQRSQGRFALVYVALGPFAGGGMRLAPPTGRPLGRLHVTLIRQSSLWHLIGLLPFLYGKHLHHRAIVTGTSAATLAVETEAGVPLEADGQLLGTGPARMTILPQRLQVIAPDVHTSDNAV